MNETAREVILRRIEVDSSTNTSKIMRESNYGKELIGKDISDTRNRLISQGWTKEGDFPLYREEYRAERWRSPDSEVQIALWQRIRWFMYVDIEGFSITFRRSKGTAVLLLRGLMNDLYKIGNDIFPSHQDRLFIYQAGDGFFVGPYDSDPNLIRPISMAFTLLKSSLMKGGCLKIGIGLGGIADISGCYPDEVRWSENPGRVRIGYGIMTTFPVMGEGIIDAHRISKLGSGPLLIVSPSLADIVNSMNILQIAGEDYMQIDWIHSHLPLEDVLLSHLGFAPSVEQLEEKLNNYLQENAGLPEKWKMAAELLIRGYNNINTTLAMK